MKALKTGLLALAMSALFHQRSEAQNWKQQLISIPTRWAEQVKSDNPLPEYPRPQLERMNWQNLNGLWEYSITSKAAVELGKTQGKILVPYPLESSLSGVMKALKPDQLLWYRRLINKPRQKAGDRVILHFGAVDWQATIYVNGKEVGSHIGGYTAFSFDITDELKSGVNEIIVKVYDPTDKGIGPHGKQVLNPANIYYTPSSGIWQTVWMEVVPEHYIQGLRMTPDVDKGLINLVVNGSGDAPVQVKVLDGKKIIATLSGLKPTQLGGEMNIAIKIPNTKLWSPDNPFLYNLEVTMGKDKVKSYFGMRKISVGKDAKGFDRIMLNNTYTYNLGTLDQGFWPDGLYTAPTDEALAFDIKAIKAMGFNTIRKHIKVEPARWYYYADKLGMMIWQDLVNPNQALPAGSKQQFEKESAEILNQLHNYPSITTWVLFNEKWGQYDQERLTKWIKKTDPSRLVNGHSGEYLYVNKELRSPSPNAYVAADMTDVHAYPSPLMPEKQQGKAQVLGEFGGIGVPVEGHLWNDLKTGWGYNGLLTPAKLEGQYAAMVDTLVDLEKQGLSASIYTQPFDVETEQNGLMTYDRKIVKLPVETFRKIHSKLLPITANYTSATKGFSARVADTIRPDFAYKLKQYNNGRRDSVLLRSLTIAAYKKEDDQLGSEVAKAYLKVIKNPFTKTNLEFVRWHSRKTTDSTFLFLSKNKERVNELMGDDWAEARLTGAIADDYFHPYVRKVANPNWLEIEKNIVDKFGVLGTEVFLQEKLLYGINKQKWNFVFQSVEPWFNYAQNREYISGYILNTISWRLFEHATDQRILEIALQMAERSIRMGEDINNLDTYANILFKLGRRNEGMKWEERALALEPNNKDLIANYEKIKANLPTWPVELSIKFDDKLDFKQVQVKAKLDKKFVMLDFMATWCGPCKEMEKYVYGDQRVGDLINKNFIPVKIQTDKTASDSEYVKSWHADADKLMKEYDVTGYPTVVFLTPEGKVIKKVVGQVDPTTFIKEVEEVIAVAKTN